MESTKTDLFKDEYFEEVRREVNAGVVKYCLLAGEIFEHNILENIPGWELDGRKFNNLFCANVYMLYKNAKIEDLSSLSKDDKNRLLFEIQDLIQEICDIVWDGPFRENEYKCNLKDWANKSKLGFLVYFAHTKVRFYTGASLSIEELALLSGLTTDEVIDELKENKLVDNTSNIELDAKIIKNNDAKFFLGEYKVC